VKSKQAAFNELVSIAQVFTDIKMKKALEETQTLRAGCNKAEPKIFEMVTTFTYSLQTQFDENRFTQFRVIEW